MDIPENLNDLKRSELQKLCKKYNIKANTKNVVMIAELEKQRNLLLRSEPIERDDLEKDVHEDSPPPNQRKRRKKEAKHSRSEPIERDDLEKDVHEDSPPPNQRKRRKKEAKHSRSKQSLESHANESNGQIESMVTSTNTSLDDSNIQISIQFNSSGANSTNFNMDATEPNVGDTSDNIFVNVQIESTKDGQINVHAVSVSPIKDTELTPPVITTVSSVPSSPCKDSVTNTVFTLSCCENSINNNISYEDALPVSTTIDSIPTTSDNTRSDNCSVDDLTSSQSLPHQRPDDVTTNIGNNAHNTTFTIESPEKQVPDPVAALSESLCNTPRLSETALNGSWAFRNEITNKWPSTGLNTTYDKEHPFSPVPISMMKEFSMVSLESPLLKSTLPQEKENTASHHDEIMALLEARVEERKNDPTYIASKPTASKIPIKSTSSMKFDKAHKKEFNKMLSISAIAERRKRMRPENTSNEQKSKKVKVQPQSHEIKTKTVNNKLSSKPTLSSVKKKMPVKPEVTPYKGTKPPFRL